MSPPTGETVPAYADVVVPRHLHRSFTYAIPPVLQGRVRIGTRVLVPFGKTTLQGVVITLSAMPPELPHARRRAGGPAPLQVKSILALAAADEGDPLTPDVLELTRQVSDRYLTPWGQCLRLVLPSRPTRLTAPKYALAPLDTSPTRATLRLSPIARTLLERLAGAPKGLSLATLQGNVTGPVAATLTSLKRRGLVREVESDTLEPSPRRRSRAPQGTRTKSLERSLFETMAVGTLAGTFQRPSWWDRFTQALDARPHAAFLLEAAFPQRLAALIEACEETQHRGRSALILVPEIARATLLSATLRTVGIARVEVLHGGLSPTQRAEVWRRLRGPQPAVVIGTRSAVFAPVAEPALIWIEEEEDSSFKEERAPRYHAREIAQVRARHHGAALVLASAHPSLETLHAIGSGAPPPVDLTRAPHLQIVDLRHSPRGVVLSEALLAGLNAALNAETQAILYLNRKGFAPALLCQECGAAPRCARCSATMTVYRRAGSLLCHYCGGSMPMPETCPTCLAPRLEPVGFGTERVEGELRRVFPRARIARLDAETTPAPARAEAFRRQFRAHDLDILIGTQMLFQGTPLPSVGFVGLPHADAGLHLPDFRAAERVYHGLLDAMALARPAGEGGRVVLQTYVPTHHAIRAVVAGDPSVFREQELAFRQALGYPPFMHLISLRVTGANSRRVKAAAERWAALLWSAGGRTPAAPAPRAGMHPGFIVLGPVASHVAQLRGKHRWKLLVKSADPEEGRRIVRATLDELEGRKKVSGLKFEVDVDPVEMI